MTRFCGGTYMCGVIKDVEQTPFHPVFLQVSQIFQRRKSDANKQEFENKLNLTSSSINPQNNRDLNQGI